MVKFQSLAGLVLLALSAGSASADETDDYIFWKTVELIDAQCHQLKNVERYAIEGVGVEILQSLPQSQHLYSGRMTSEDYTAWIGGIEERAAAEAKRLGCTAEAQPYLLRGRGAASEIIYQNLILAVHFNTLPKEDQAHQALTTDQMQAATGYDQFLQQVYGARFEEFAAAQRTQASLRLPQADPLGMGGFYDPLSPVPEAGTDYAALWTLQAEIRKTLSDILFEVYAEVAGYKLWQEPVGNNQVVAFHPSGSTEASVHLISGPDRFDVVGGGTLNAVLVRMLSGELWLMSYGEEANKPATKGAEVAMLVRTEPLPEGQSASEAWSGKGWRGLTTRFDLSPVDSSCLGGPCWKVPAEARERLLDLPAFEDVELWVSVDPAASPEPQSDPYKRGKLRHFALNLLEGRPLN